MGQIRVVLKGIPAVCLSGPSWQRGGRLKPQGRKHRREALATSCHLTCSVETVDCVPVAVSLVWGLDCGVREEPGGEEEGWAARSGCGQRCEAARVLCVPEVQVLPGGMECSLLPSKSRNSSGIA